MARKSTDERKKEIVEAALELIGEKGIASLRTSEIAEKVGFTEAAMYKHFDRKENILRETVKTAGGRLMEALADVEDRGLGEMYSVMETHIEFLQSNPGIIRILFSEEVHFNRKELRSELLKVVGRYRELVMGILEGAEKEGELKKNLDKEAIFDIYFGVLQSSLVIWSLNDGKTSLMERFEKTWEEFEKAIKVQGEKG